MLANNVVLAAIISTVGGGLITWASQRVYRQRRDRRLPANPTQFALESYEKLLRDQQKEIARKSDIIDRLDNEVSALQEMINMLRSELSDTKSQNRQLQHDIETFKTDYNAGKL